MIDDTYDDYLNDPFLKHLFNIMIKRLDVNSKIKEHIKITHMINLLNQSHLLSDNTIASKDKSQLLKKLNLNNNDFNHVGSLLSMFIEINVFIRERYMIQHLKHHPSPFYSSIGDFFKDHIISFENIKSINITDFENKYDQQRQAENNITNNETLFPELIFTSEYKDILPLSININQFCFQIEQT